MEKWDPEEYEEAIRRNRKLFNATIGNKQKRGGF